MNTTDVASQPPLTNDRSQVSNHLISASQTPQLTIHKLDLGLIPIPASCRCDPNLNPEDQILFTWQTNLVFALAAVCLDFTFPRHAC